MDGAEGTGNHRDRHGICRPNRRHLGPAEHLGRIGSVEERSSTLWTASHGKLHVQYTRLVARGVQVVDKIQGHGLKEILQVNGMVQSVDSYFGGTARNPTVL